MPVDPHAKRVLDMLAAAGPVSGPLLSIVARRASFEKLMSLFESRVPVHRVEDSTLPVPGGELSVRVYTPSEAPSPPLPSLG
jgi:acetyl esterase